MFTFCKSRENFLNYAIRQVTTCAVTQLVIHPELPSYQEVEVNTKHLTKDSKKSSEMFRQVKFCFELAKQLTRRPLQPQVLGLSLVKRAAGHSKWANIKHDKFIADQKRANIFARLARQIRIAIQDGGGVTNPATNVYLKTVIDQATKLNMPMATISNQIKKFNANDVQLKRYTIEMKSINKVFLICELFTDNLALTKASIHTAMRRAGSTTIGDVKHAFEEMGIIQVSKPDGVYTDAADFENKLTEDAIEFDAQEVEDIDFDSKSATFICRPIEIEKVKRLLLSKNYSIDFAEPAFIPTNTFRITEDEQKIVTNLKQRLMQIEGVENVFDNVEVVQPST